MPDDIPTQHTPHQSPTRPPQEQPNSHDSANNRSRRKADIPVPPHERFHRPVEFVRHDLKTPLWGKQAQILRAIKRNRRTAVRSCNGSGKTFVAATAVIWWLMAHPNDPAMVVTTAPTQHQVSDLLWREIRSLYHRNSSVIHLSSNNQSSLPSREGVRVWVQSGDTDTTQNGEFKPKLGLTSLELSPNHYATGLSTDSPERFQGFHEENILFVVDEASGVREEVFDAIEGSMTSRRARLLLIGNPTSLAGTFYKAFHQRRTQYKTIHISAFDTPNMLAQASSETSLLREGPREGRMRRGSQVVRRRSDPNAKRRPSHPMTPGANEDRGGVPLVRHPELDSGPRTAPDSAADAILPVVTRDAHSQPDPVEQSRETALLPPQNGNALPPVSCPPSLHGRELEGGLASCPSAKARPAQTHHKPIPGIVQSHWVDEASTTWGENSAQYQVRVLGEFPTQADDTLIPLTHIEAALSTKSDPTPAHRTQNSTSSNDAARPATKGPLPQGEGLGEGERQRSTQFSPDLTQPIHIGVDVARFGTDRTVICVRQGNHVLALNQHQKLNTMRTTGLVVNAIHKYGPHTVNIDEIGIGAGVLDRLHELGYNDPAGRSVLPRTGGARGGDLRRATKSSDDARSKEESPTTSATNAKTVVHGVNVGNRATDPEHFFNLRSELYDNLRARFEEQTIVIPNDDDLIGQLAAIRVEYTSKGQLKVEPKETMRRRSLPSPDKADALLLAFAPTKERTKLEIWV